MVVFLAIYGQTARTMNVIAACLLSAIFAQGQQTIVCWALLKRTTNAPYLLKQSLYCLKGTVSQFHAWCSSTDVSGVLPGMILAGEVSLVFFGVQNAQE